jgi:hypothetical protein
MDFGNITGKLPHTKAGIITVAGQIMQPAKKIADIEQADKLFTDDWFPVLSSDKSPKNQTCDSV